MNRIISIFILLVIDIALYGQVYCPRARNTQSMLAIDSGMVKISYAFNATDIKDYNTYDDFQVLEIGTTLSKYYSFFVYNCDSLVTDFVKNHPGAQGIPNWIGISGKDQDSWSEYHYSEYFKDFTKNTFIEYARMPGNLEKTDAYYVEELPVFDWQIDTDTLTVLSYLCQKASCHFRGRDYTAWFAPDIPINNGPWKFGGLPGLILKISDTGNRCDFECINIEQFRQKYPIKKYPEYETKYKKKDRIEILKFQKKIHEEYHVMVGLHPVDLVNGKFVPSNRPVHKIKYEPIELE